MRSRKPQQKEEQKSASSFSSTKFKTIVKIRCENSKYFCAQFKICGKGPVVQAFIQHPVDPLTPMSSFQTSDSTLTFKTSARVTPQK